MTYTTTRIEASRLRLPLQGSLDLTYRCNNTCRHCWLWQPANAPEAHDELTFDEIRRIADEARALGCREWAISGGEPMLRPDFPEIFDYLTRRATTYSLNTNGTLITPQIAQLLTRKGDKMVALYGATAETYDRVTRNPGGFEQAMRGFAYLREAGAGFTVQLIPMRDNWHEWPQMIALAQSLSQRWRVGAAWLFKSACGSAAHNAEIERQRLDPRDVVELDKPEVAYVERERASDPECLCGEGDDRLFASCIEIRRDFHIDPFGQMTFCAFIKDPALRYDLRKGTFQDAWEHFIPSLADKVHGGPDYRANCAECDLRADCRWCPVYGYLEHRDFSAKVEYLCAVAGENRRFKEDWLANHRRYYEIAGITVQVESDLPITDATFDPKFQLFRADGPGGEDAISVHHHFSLPDLNDDDLGQEVYRKPPWVIYRKEDSWIYRGLSSDSRHSRPHQVAVFNRDHTRGHIYHPDEAAFRKGDLQSLTLMPTDQILLARVLADRQGCYLHSAGVILNGKGLLFVGHSDAGKSTTVTMLRDRAEILCDDRNIVRRWPGGFKVHGTWSHGDVPTVSPASAPLHAILFLHQSKENRIRPAEDRLAVLGKLLACVIRPFVTGDWWEKTLATVEDLAREVPCYDMAFDKSGAVVDLLADLVE